MRSIRQWGFTYLALGFLFVSAIGFVTKAQAQQPKVGRKAASAYFAKDADASQETHSRSSAGGENVLMLHLGKYVGSQAYQWKDSGKQDNVGRASYGVSYLFDEWGGLDTFIRVDFNEYDVNGTKASKLSLLPLWTFPRAESRFPLYFGIGAGLGVFFTQVEGESNLALDYQLVAGARFMDLADTNGGFFIEYGMKNHLHILSDGQLNGTVVTGGAIFTF